MANNASLVLISLSLNQIIRSGIPIVTASLGIAIEHTVRGILCTPYHPFWTPHCAGLPQGLAIDNGLKRLQHPNAMSFLLCSLPSGTVGDHTL